jgi:uridylate kinase
MRAELIIKATKVNGVYDKDPEKYSDAIRYSTISYSEALAKDLRIMDATAIALAREEKIPIKVINFFEPDTLVRTLNGEDLGTLVV